MAFLTGSARSKAFLWVRSATYALSGLERSRRLIRHARMTGHKLRTAAIGERVATGTTLGAPLRPTHLHLLPLETKLSRDVCLAFQETSAAAPPVRATRTVLLIETHADPVHQIPRPASIRTQQPLPLMRRQSNPAGGDPVVEADDK